ncbi:hypothetical protein LshimejAT787_0603210 [Lyophyllum shimeji]|uniref:Uncharacterized protein n=1 Tax=Lyophyllum shimeji TaxID=47721 RepID=A0A9P3ULE4_LYOSH|nr:hypothetical protein LshimejAT787_0603210 [Lyophyllum shimeji]
METVTPYLRNVALGSALSTAPRDDLNKLMSLLLRLDGVRGLSFGGQGWSSLTEASTRSLFKPGGNLFQNVTTLHLKHLQFTSFSLLATFVGGVSMLNDLSFDDVTWDLVDRQLCIPPPRLVRLHIRSSLVPILDWLFGSGDSMGSQEPPSLRALSIPEVDPHELHTVGRVLRVLGSSLQHLDVGFPTHGRDNADMGNISDVINLSHNQNLRTIHIRHLTLYQFPHPVRTYSLIAPTGGEDEPELSNSPFCWLPPFLSNVSSPAISELVLYIWLSDERHLDLIDWPALTGVLNKSVFASLKSIQYRVSGLGAGRGDVQSWLLARLSGWKAFENTVQITFEAP